MRISSEGGEPDFKAEGGWQRCLLHVVQSRTRPELNAILEEVTRFANDHLAPSQSLGAAGAGGGQCLLPISLRKERRGRGMRQDA